MRDSLRGLNGTDDAMLAGAAVGRDAVVLDAAAVPLGLSARDVGLARNYAAETAQGRVDPKAPYVFAGGLRAETPFSPVHLRARRLDTGDVVLTWVRRSRIDADDWSAAEIPLDEDSESYRLEIFPVRLCCEALKRRRRSTRILKPTRLPISACCLICLRSGYVSAAERSRSVLR
nr:hypothetical protein [Marinicella sp. W31]MDC2876564.1 hypothetical protein [Marinicella sp. W31]